MSYFNLYLLLLGMLNVPSNIYAQSKNNISIETGLFHCFFDGSPILNINYQKKGYKPFKGLFINSVAINYSRRIKANNVVSIGASSFRETYFKHGSADHKLVKPIAFDRLYTSININYSRIKPLNRGFDFLYGGGVTVRLGSESVIVNRGIIGYTANGEPLYELNLENCILGDIGINNFVGVNYTPVKWLTIYTKLNFLGFIFLNKTDARERLREIYDSPNHPSRFDLSWQFGIGFNFGKRELNAKANSLHTK